MSPDSLLPNRFIRSLVTNFRCETGYTKAVPSVPPAPEVAADSVKEEKETEETLEEKEEPELILEVVLYRDSRLMFV